MTAFGTTFSATELSRFVYPNQQYKEQNSCSNKESEQKLTCYKFTGESFPRAKSEFCPLAHIGIPSEEKEHIITHSKHFNGIAQKAANGAIEMPNSTGGSMSNLAALSPSTNVIRLTTDTSVRCRQVNSFERSKLCCTHICLTA